MTDPIVECDPVDPHPDAVYNGTCPAPDGWEPPPGWEEPDATDDPAVAPTEPQPTSDGVTGTVSASPSASDTSGDGSGTGDGSTLSDSDSTDFLPVTGTDVTIPAGIASFLVFAGVVIVLWSKKRRQRSGLDSGLLSFR